ncbi:MAG: hypothetical protein CO137_01840 [Candidatus Magasanikbacteria bacterium CG_4_9_14_3_um_filter_32_9]|uniref:DUF1573 domain-containing protein n=1 Tax=Candidatus Magasanikbacteria bacterium CG_4_9_14_3_um_filter_32_9 TaxID=1974644 RepID=A0A2M7Z6W2_9BACT|nr:MAG: hypothetical protein CO137_01840 [Candidatus Magasanikbacteria bacterium CG_4_9_14_3_um_filter_32_9]
MKSILISIAVIAGLIVFVKVTSDTNSDNSSTPTFVAKKVLSEVMIINQDVLLDLGEIPIQGGTVDAEFKFKNNGPDKVSLVYGETSCMCTQAIIKKDNGELSPRIEMQGHGSNGVLKMILEPGEEATLIATFDPMAHGPDAIGPITREVIIKTNSETTPELIFEFQGNVVR